VKQQALDGIEAAILLCRAARQQVERRIARRKVQGLDMDRERNLRARLNRKIADLRELEVELEAAESVASAPSVADIQAANDLVSRINDLAITDAAREAALTMLSDAVGRADELRRGVSMA
jgi:hypothetical protein